MLGIFRSSLFFSTFLLSHHLDKGSSLSHRFINTVPKFFWLTFVLFANSNLTFLFLVLVRGLQSCCAASVILCQSLLRTVDCQSITPAFWKLLLILQIRLLGFIFTAFMISLSSATVVFSADQVVVGGLQTLDFSMPFVFARALIDFLFSFSIQIACFSLKVSSLIFILVCVCHHRMQDSEYRSNGYKWYDTFPAFNIWRFNATGHSWSLRKTREATVPILMFTSDRRMNSKSPERLSW